MSQPAELHSLTTADGKAMFLPTAKAAIRVFAGYGAAPTEFLTRHGHQQHGVTEIGFHLAPRTVSLQLWQKEGCTRQDYWDMRSRLHEFLRPNRGGPLRLEIRQPNGQRRALRVRANPGLVFPPVEDNSWQIDDVIEFIAFDPVWFDPTPQEFGSYGSAPEELVFPVTFPITFGSGGLNISTGAFSYPGTWVSYPTITLTGPFRRAVIVHQTSNLRLYLNARIDPGEKRILDLTPGAQRLIDERGINRFGDLDPGSNLVDFKILPTPLAPNGVNEITARIYGGTLNSTHFKITFFNRYFGI